jgi:hypothetical protein
MRDLAVQPSVNPPYQRNGVHVDPETLRQLCEIAPHISNTLPNACKNIDATTLDVALKLARIGWQGTLNGVEATAHFVNTDAPAVRNITSVIGSALGIYGGKIAYENFVRQRPAILEKRVNLPILDQKSELEDPIADAFGVLETVSEKCAEFVENPQLHFLNTIQQAKIAQDAKRAIRSMVVREKESTEFGTGSTNKSGIDLSTLYMVGLNASPEFPKRNQFANWRANALEGTWFEL